MCRARAIKADGRMWTFIRSAISNSVTRSRRYGSNPSNWDQERIRATDLLLIAQTLLDARGELLSTVCPNCNESSRHAFPAFSFSVTK